MHVCTAAIHADQTHETSHARTAPVTFREQARSRRRGLTARPAGPVMREAAGPARRAAELQAVREALADSRAVPERVLERVVERLLSELSA